MTPEAIRTLYDYSYWAFERVWECVSPLTDEQFTRDVGYSAGSVRNQVVHIMSGTHRWMKRLQRVEVPPPLPFEDYPTRAAAKTQWDAMRADVLEYIYSLTPAQLDETIHWEIGSRGIERANRRWELLLHVANHATDHRAQILATLHHHFGVQTIEQDMVLYLAVLNL